MSYGINGMLTLNFFDFLKDRFFLIFLAKSHLKKLNDKLQKNMIYIRLENIESNSISDWFKKNIQFIACLLSLLVKKFLKQIFPGDQKEVQEIQ